MAQQIWLSGLSRNTPRHKNFGLFLLVLIFSSLFFDLGCTRSSVLRSQRWQASPDGDTENSAPPQLLTNQTLKSESSFQTNKEEISFSSQTINGIKVDGSYLKQIRNKRGLVFQYSLLTDKTAQASSHIDPLGAWEAFLHRNPGYKSWKKQSEVEPIWKTNGKLTLAYRCVISHSTTQFYQLDFSPKGEIQALEMVGSRAFADEDNIGLPGLVYPKGFKKGELKTVRLNPSTINAGLNSELLRIETESPAQIKDPKDLIFEPGDLKFDQVQSYFYSQRFLQWFKTRFQVETLSPIRILTHVGYPEKTNTMFYFQGMIRLGQGDDESFSQVNWDPTIITHEASHALIDRLAHLPFQGEGGSINEGFADTFTTLFLQSPLLGDSAYKKANFKRAVTSVVKWNERNGGLYHDSAVVSSLFWELQSLVGLEKTLDLAFKTLSRLTPDSKFTDFKNSLLQQAPNVLDHDKHELFQKTLQDRGFL